MRYNVSGFVVLYQLVKMQRSVSGHSFFSGTVPLSIAYRLIYYMRFIINTDFFDNEPVKTYFDQLLIGT